MEAGYERWIGDAEGFGDFRFIQDGRGLFPSSMPANILHNFCRDFPNILRRWQQSLRAGMSPHRFKSPGEADFCVVEMRMGGGWRLYAIFTKGRVTLLDAACREEQRARMRGFLEDRDWVLEHGEEIPGFRQMPTMEFLRLLYLYLARQKWQFSTEIFRIIFQEGLDAVLDDVQRDVVESSDYIDSARLFMIGTAGTGKTLAGMRWLADHRIEDEERLMLSLSAPQCRLSRERWEQENAMRAKLGRSLLPPTRHETAFGFLLDHARPYLEKGQRVMDADESYGMFREIAGNLPSVYWKPIPGTSAIGKSFLLWQEIRGMIKGALFRRDISGENAPLSREQYSALRSFHGGGEGGSRLLTGQAITLLFRLYERYEKHREERHFLDDNDLARLVLDHLDEIKSSEGFRRYGLAFLDDCQELTEVQQLAIHSLLSGCVQMLMAADPGQMLHPTSFHLGFAQQLAERLNEAEGECSSQRWTLMRQCRSSFDILRLQNAVLEEIGSRRSFGEGIFSTSKPSESDMGDGAQPIWIVDTPGNRELLQKLFVDMGRCVNVARAVERDGEVHGSSLAALRGLGVSAVLVLWNVFSEAARYVGESAAWSCFYAAASRAERYLVILEPDEGAMGEFLSKMAEDGTIEKCSSPGDPHEGDETWLGTIRSWAGQVAADSRAHQMLRLFLRGRYEQVLGLCRMDPSSDENGQMEMACEGRLAEERGEPESALRCYMGLAEVSPDGKYFIEGLLEQPGLSEEEDLAASLCFLGDAERGYGDGSGLKHIYEEYRKRGGARPMGELLEELGERYPMVREQLKKWTDDIMDGMALEAMSIANVVGTEAAWRQESDEQRDI